jgi:hypothetical protein
MRTFAALVAVGLVVAGCGQSLDQPTETAAHAMTSVAGYLRQAIDATMKSAQFSTTSSSTDSGSCVAGNTDSDFTGQVQAQLTYETTATSAEPELTALRNYWTGQHYSVDESTNHLITYLDNGYQLAASYYPDRHKLDITGISACVWTNGTSPTSTF